MSEQAPPSQPVERQADAHLVDSAEYDWHSFGDSELDAKIAADVARGAEARLGPEVLRASVETEVSDENRLTSLELIMNDSGLSLDDAEDVLHWMQASGIVAKTHEEDWESSYAILRDSAEFKALFAQPKQPETPATENSSDIPKTRTRRAATRAVTTIGGDQPVSATKAEPVASLPSPYARPQAAVDQEQTVVLPNPAKSPEENIEDFAAKLSDAQANQLNAAYHFIENYIYPGQGLSAADVYEHLEGQGQLTDVSRQLFDASLEHAAALGGFLIPDGTLLMSDGEVMKYYIRAGDPADTGENMTAQEASAAETTTPGDLPDPAQWRRTLEYVAAGDPRNHKPFETMSRASIARQLGFNLGDAAKLHAALRAQGVLAQDSNKIVMTGPDMLNLAPKVTDGKEEKSSTGPKPGDAESTAAAEPKTPEEHLQQFDESLSDEQHKALNKVIDHVNSLNLGPNEALWVSKSFRDALGTNPDVNAADKNTRKAAMKADQELFAKYQEYLDIAQDQRRVGVAHWPSSNGEYRPLEWNKKPMSYLVDSSNPLQKLKERSAQPSAASGQSNQTRSNETHRSEDSGDRTRGPRGERFARARRIGRRLIELDQKTVPIMDKMIDTRDAVVRRAVESFKNVDWEAMRAEGERRRLLTNRTFKAGAKINANAVRKAYGKVTTAVGRRRAKRAQKPEGHDELTDDLVDINK